MAIATVAQWDIRANGTANGGGFFVSGGTDYSQQDAVHSARTDIVIDGADNTKITSAGDPFALDDVGNGIRIFSGTGFTVGWYEILSEAAGVATLDRAVGTVASTGGNGNLGGAVLFVDATFEAMQPGNKANVKNDGTHTLIASISVNNDGTTALPIVIEGYNTTQADGPNDTSRPLIAAGSNSVTFDNYWCLINIRITATSVSATRADIGGTYINVKVENTSGTAGRDAFRLNGGDGCLINCEAVSTNGKAVSLPTDSNSAFGCYIHDSVDGIDLFTRQDMTISNCIIDTCTNGILIGSGSNTHKFTNNTIYNCTTGVSADNTALSMFLNNVIDSCTTGASWTTQMDTNVWDYNNWNNNTSDVSNVSKGSNTTSLSPAFTDAPNGDFSVGTNLKGTALPTPSFPGGLTENFLDQGAAQREEPAGGGGSSEHSFGFIT